MTPNLDPLKVLRDAGEASGGVGVAYLALMGLENVAHLPSLVTDIADGSFTTVLVLGAIWSCTAIGKSIWRSFNTKKIEKRPELKLLSDDELRATFDDLQKQILRVEEMLNRSGKP